MPSKILKRLAIVAGTGLAIGLNSGRSNSGKQGNASTSMNTPSSEGPSEGILSLEPLLDRLDRVEFRISAVEARAVPAQSDIEALQLQLNEMRQRVASDVKREIPAILESIIGPQVEYIRIRLEADLQESTKNTLATFEQALDNKVSLRMSMLEKALIEQSGIITTLSERAIESDTNMQRLISAVEKLCEARPTPAVRESSFPELPFERHLSEAIKGQPEPPVQYPDSGFRPRIVTEEDNKPRHRKPLARL
jgi:hypothetical protein